jgi:hypothetical protein
VKRRDFVSMLIGGSTAAILVPKRVFSLPPEPGYEFKWADDRYLEPAHRWFLVDPPPQIMLSEASLEKLCDDIRVLTRDRAEAITARITVRPTRIVGWRT